MRTNGKRILIVEDDQALALALKDAFKAEGAVVLGPAPTVFYARHLLGRRGIDCAIISADLHAGESAVFCEQLSAIGTPVVTLSLAEGQERSAAQVMQRPVAPHEVVNSVVSILSQPAVEEEKITISSKRAAEVFGLDMNPHMRLMRVHSESMRRQLDGQKQKPL